MGRFEGAAAAGAAAAGRYALQIQPQQNRFSVNSGERKIHVVGQSFGGMPVQNAIGYAPRNLGYDAVTQRQAAGSDSVAFAVCQLQSYCQTNDAGYVFGA